jgi:hypothetical protein
MVSSSLLVVSASILHVAALPVVDVLKGDKREGQCMCILVVPNVATHLLFARLSPHSSPLESHNAGKTRSTGE